MSADYHIHCEACDERHPTETRREDDLLTLLSQRHLLAELSEFADRLHDVSLKAEFGVVDLDAALWWFLRHRGHRLVVRDEYGGLHDQCHQNIACGECGSRKRCGLKHGHEGDCARLEGRRG